MCVSVAEGPCQRNSLPTFAFCPKIKQHWQEIVLASYAQLLPTCIVALVSAEILEARVCSGPQGVTGQSARACVCVRVRVWVLVYAKPLAERSEREKFEGCQ